MGKLPDDWIKGNFTSVFKKGIGTLWQTTGQYLSHVFVPNYLNTSFVNKLCPIFLKIKILTPVQHMAFDQNTYEKGSF